MWYRYVFSLSLFSLSYLNHVSVLPTFCPSLNLFYLSPLSVSSLICIFSSTLPLGTRWKTFNGWKARWKDRLIDWLVDLLTDGWMGLNDSKIWLLIIDEGWVCGSYRTPWHYWGCQNNSFRSSPMVHGHSSLCTYQTVPWEQCSKASLNKLLFSSRAEANVIF